MDKSEKRPAKPAKYRIVNTQKKRIRKMKKIECMDRVVLNRNWERCEYTDNSINRLAYYAAGQALACVICEFEVEYVSIEPSDRPLGHVSIPNTDCLTCEEEVDCPCFLPVLLAGAVAEEIYTGEMLPYFDYSRMTAIAFLLACVTDEYPDGIELLLAPDGLSEGDRLVLTAELDLFLLEHGEDLSELQDIIRIIFFEERPSLDSIANALLKRRRLTGMDLDDLLQEASINIWQSN